MSALWVRARPQITGPSTLRAIALDRLEVAGRGDREAGLDHVDAEARQLLGDLDLLAGVQRDAGRLLAVAQGGVEDVDTLAMPVLLMSSSFSECLPMTCRLRLTRRPALFPPRGEEKEKREAVEPAAHWFAESSTAVRGTRTTLPMFLRSAMNWWASPARSNGKASATTGLELRRCDLGLKRLDDPGQPGLGVGPGEHVEAEDPLVLVHHLEALPPRHRRERPPHQGAGGLADAAAGPGRGLGEPVHDQAAARRSRR